LKGKIIDITENRKFELYLYRCLAPAPFRRYGRRQEYLEKAIPKGFHKKLLIFDGKVVGQIEYAPAEVSGYPIVGDNVVVMNCIWVLRKAKGHHFGKQLLENMMKSEKDVAGFATVALENHWSPWLVKWQMEKLGFKSIDRIRVMHKTKHKKEVFTVYLMWMPMKEGAEPPTWDKKALLRGQTFCYSHPLYRPQTLKGNLLEAE
jgi:ribosomal protein S18 acetylase RimI-like enzyme